MDKRFQRFFERVESYLFFITVCFIIMLILIQALMIRGDVRQYLSRVDLLEGEPYAYIINDEEDDPFERPAGSTGHTGSPFSLTLEVAPPHTSISVLVNGEKKAAFLNEILTIDVEPGDLIEVEGEINGEAAVITITDTVGLKQPEVGSKTVFFGDNELIGWAIP